MRGRSSRLLGLWLVGVLLGRGRHSLADRLTRLLVVVDVAAGTLGRSPAALLAVRLMGRILGVRRRSTDVIWHSVAGVAAGGTVRGRARRWRLTRLAAGTAGSVRARILRPGRVTALRMW